MFVPWGFPKMLIFELLIDLLFEKLSVLVENFTVLIVLKEKLLAKMVKLFKRLWTNLELCE